MKKKNITQLHEYLTCKIFITNSSKLVSNERAFYFCKEYIEYYLVGQGSYKPIEVENSATIQVELNNDKEHFNILVDNKIHVTMNIKKFHNAECHTEITSYFHQEFFMKIRMRNYSGINIIEHYSF